MREYTTAPPFEKPVFTDTRPVRDWTATPYVPSDSIYARMARAAIRAAMRHLANGDMKKYRQRMLASEILNRSDRK